MDNGLQIFNSQEVLGKDFKVYGDIDNPLFLAKDVAEWIEYSWTNAKKTARKTGQMLEVVDEDEKIKATLSMLHCSTPSSHGGIRENTEMWFLTEDGLYEVLMQSRKPIAKAFKKEVKRILKQIRKTGSYSINPTPTESYMVDDPIDRAKAWIREYEEKLALENTVKEQAPKVKVYNNFIDKEHTLGFRELRHELESTYNMSIKESDLKKFLRKNGLIGKSNKMTALAYGTRNGYVVVKDAMCESGHTVTQVRFTMKTRDLVSNHIETKLAEIKSRIN